MSGHQLRFLSQKTRRREADVEFLVRCFADQLQAAGRAAIDRYVVAFRVKADLVARDVSEGALRSQILDYRGAGDLRQAWFVGESL